MSLRLATYPRPALTATLLALAACTMDTPPEDPPPASPNATIDVNPVSGEEYVCVTSSYDLTECTLRADYQPYTPAP